MNKVRDQQGRFISSSKTPKKLIVQVNHKRERSSINEITYHLQQVFLSKPKTSLRESETVQGSMHTEVPPSEGLINEQCHFEEFIFPEVPKETIDNPRREMARGIFKEETSTFRFPIRGSNEGTKMNNIPHSTLPNFHGLSKEDLDTFVFEFDVLCKSYDYVSDAHKLKLFLATLKDVALRWFMGLGKDNILTWD